MIEKKGHLGDMNQPPLAGHGGSKRLGKYLIHVARIPLFWHSSKSCADVVVFEQAFLA